MTADPTTTALEQITAERDRLRAEVLRLSKALAVDRALCHEAFELGVNKADLDNEARATTFDGWWNAKESIR